MRNGAEFLTGRWRCDCRIYNNEMGSKSYINYNDKIKFFILISTLILIVLPMLYHSQRNLIKNEKRLFMS